MPRYCHNRPLGTTPNAKIRIPTPYAAATRGPVPKIGCKDVAKCTHAALAPLRLGFSLILGLGWFVARRPAAGFLRVAGDCRVAGDKGTPLVKGPERHPQMMPRPIWCQ